MWQIFLAIMALIFFIPPPKEATCAHLERDVGDPAIQTRGMSAGRWSVDLNWSQMPTAADVPTWTGLTDVRVEGNALVGRLSQTDNDCFKLYSEPPYFCPC